MLYVLMEDGKVKTRRRCPFILETRRPRPDDRLSTADCGSGHAMEVNRKYFVVCATHVRRCKKSRVCLLRFDESIEPIACRLGNSCKHVNRWKKSRFCSLRLADERTGLCKGRVGDDLLYRHEIYQLQLGRPVRVYEGLYGLHGLHGMNGMNGMSLEREQYSSTNGWTSPYCGCNCSCG